MNRSSSMLDVYPCSCGGDHIRKSPRMRESRKCAEKTRESRSKNSSHSKLRGCGSCPPTGRYEKPSKRGGKHDGKPAECSCCPGACPATTSSDQGSKTTKSTISSRISDEVPCKEPFHCPDYDQPAVALTCRLRQVRCFGEMVFDETRFLRFCKRLHIVLGTCVYSWLMAFFCLLESISYRYYFEEVRFYFQQNEFIENLLDYCCIIEGKLIEWMTCPCECGDIWHYFKLLVLMPFLLSNSVISIKLSFVLKVKLFIFGERCICGDLNPKQKIPLGIRRCTCGATAGILKGSQEQLQDKKVCLNVDNQLETDVDESTPVEQLITRSASAAASAAASKQGSGSKLASEAALSKQSSRASKVESLKNSGSLGSASSAARRASEARRLSEQRLLNEAKRLSERLIEAKRLSESKRSSSDSKSPSS